jgi:hypothetical protein
MHILYKYMWISSRWRVIWSSRLHGADMSQDYSLHYLFLTTLLFICIVAGLAKAGREGEESI